MAYTKSGWYLHTVAAMMLGTSITGGPINLTATTPKLSLLSNATTDGSSPVNFSTTDSHWVSTDEVTGTGWATGGIALSAIASGGTSAAPTFAEGTTGSLRYNMSAAAVSGTTLSNLNGCIIYYAAATAPADLANAMFLSICFGAAYSTSSGTLTITWSGTGLSEIDLTP